MAGSLPFLPQRFMVKAETLSRSATSLIVKRSGKSDSDTFAEGLNLFVIVCIIKCKIALVNSIFLCHPDYIGFQFAES